jgi:hypothetical protein
MFVARVSVGEAITTADFALGRNLRFCARVFIHRNIRLFAFGHETRVARHPTAFEAIKASMPVGSVAVEPQIGEIGGVLRAVREGYSGVIRRIVAAAEKE